MPLLYEGLLPASFRGVPFAVQATDGAFGRRVAMHVYPGRDTPWAEDMGRAPRQFRLRGFILTDDVVYKGGPVALQRALLTAASEKKGSGLLTHPTLGVLQVACRGLSLGEDLDAGTRSEVSFDFIESGKKSFPTILSSSSGILSASTLVAAALALDVARVVDAALQSGSGQQDGVAAAASWGGKVTALGADATSLSKLAALLPGNYGRFAGGANAGFTGSTASPYASTTTVADLAAEASAQRLAIANAAAVMNAVMGAIGADAAAADIGPAATDLVNALRASCADPADAIRLLLQLVGYAPDSSAIGAALGFAFQRAVAAALATAAAQYQPSSYEDAFELLASVAGALDAIAEQAADAGDDASHDALRQLKLQVVQDLRARGASLAHVMTFAMPAAMPMVALAQRLYRNAARADELVHETACIHPLFMPIAFQALAA